MDAELDVKVAQVVVDSLWTQQQRRRGLARGLSAGQQQRDLELLGRQLVERRRVPAAESLPGGLKLGVGSVGPRTGV